MEVPAQLQKARTGGSNNGPVPMKKPSSSMPAMGKEQADAPQQAASLSKTPLLPSKAASRTQQQMEQLWIPTIRYYEASATADALEEAPWWSFLVRRQNIQMSILALLFWILCILVHTFCTRVSWDRGIKFQMVGTARLHDILFETLPDTQRLRVIPEIGHVLPVLYLSGLMLYHFDQRSLDCFRTFLVSHGVLLVLRAVSFVGTLLPDASQQCHVSLFVGSCHDLIFSGHVTIMLICILLAQHFYDIPPVLRVFVGLDAVLVCFFVVSSRNHYTVDVVLAVVITFLVYLAFTRHPFLVSLCVETPVNVLAMPCLMDASQPGGRCGCVGPDQKLRTNREGYRLLSDGKALKLMTEHAFASMRLLGLKPSIVMKMVSVPQGSLAAGGMGTLGAPGHAAATLGLAEAAADSSSPSFTSSPAASPRRMSAATLSGTPGAGSRKPSFVQLPPSAMGQPGSASGVRPRAATTSGFYDSSLSGLYAGGSASMHHLPSTSAPLIAQHQQQEQQMRSHQRYFSSPLDEAEEQQHQEQHGSQLRRRHTFHPQQQHHQLSGTPTGSATATMASASASGAYRRAATFHSPSGAGDIIGMEASIGRMGEDDDDEALEPPVYASHKQHRAEGAAGVAAGLPSRSRGLSGSFLIPGLNGMEDSSNNRSVSSGSASNPAAVVAASHGGGTGGSFSVASSTTSSRSSFGVPPSTSGPMPAPLPSAGRRSNRASPAATMGGMGMGMEPVRESRGGEDDDDVAGTPPLAQAAAPLAPVLSPQRSVSSPAAAASSGTPPAPPSTADERLMASGGIAGRRGSSSKVSGSGSGGKPQASLPRSRAGSSSLVQEAPMTTASGGGAAGSYMMQQQQQQRRAAGQHYGSSQQPQLRTVASAGGSGMGSKRSSIASVASAPAAGASGRNTFAPPAHLSSGRQHQPYPAMPPHIQTYAGAGGPRGGYPAAAVGHGHDDDDEAAAAATMSALDLERYEIEEALAQLILARHRHYTPNRAHLAHEISQAYSRVQNSARALLLRPFDWVKGVVERRRSGAEEADDGGGYGDEDDQGHQVDDDDGVGDDAGMRGHGEEDDDLGPEMRASPSVDQETEAEDGLDGPLGALEGDEAGQDADGAPVAPGSLEEAGEAAGASPFSPVPPAIPTLPRSVTRSGSSERPQPPQRRNESAEKRSD